MLFGTLTSTNFLSWERNSIDSMNLSEEEYLKVKQEALNYLSDIGQCLQDRINPGRQQQEFLDRWKQRCEKEQWYSHDFLLVDTYLEMKKKR